MLCYFAIAEPSRKRKQKNMPHATNMPMQATKEQDGVKRRSWILCQRRTKPKGGGMHVQERGGHSSTGSLHKEQTQLRVREHHCHWCPCKTTMQRESAMWKLCALWLTATWLESTQVAIVCSIPSSTAAATQQWLLNAHANQHPCLLVLSLRNAAAKLGTFSVTVRLPTDNRQQW